MGKKFSFLSFHSQLRYDGYESAAINLSRNFSTYPPTAPSSRLAHLVKLGMQMEGEGSINSDSHSIVNILHCF